MPSGTVNLTDISNSGLIIGGGSIVKESSGMLILTGNNTYAGGTIGGNVTVNGTISPGNSIGMLNIGGN